MTDPVLPAWEDDPFSRFLSDAARNERVAALKMPDIYALLRDTNRVFARLAEITEKEHTENLILPRILMARSRGAWLAATRAGMSGQVVEAYPTIRVTIENAWYALHLAKDPAPIARAKIWLGRHDDDASKQQCRAEFSIKRVTETHRGLDPANEAIVHNLYDQTIDYGGHPNERGVASSMSRQDTDEARTFQVSLLDNKPARIALALKMATEAAIGALKTFGLIFPERFKIMDLDADIEKLVVGTVVFNSYKP